MPKHTVPRELHATHLPSLINVGEEPIMDLGLNGKVAIVAASSNGLGRATAMQLAREGALVTHPRGQDAT